MNKAKVNIDPEKLHLKFVEEVSVELEGFDILKEINPSIEIKVAHTSGHNIEKKKYLLGLQVVFLTTNLTENIECKFRYNFHFSVDNFDDMFEPNKEGEPIFQKLFVATLAGISYSTLRGIILERTKDKTFGSLLLPVINPTLILESWIGKD